LVFLGTSLLTINLFGRKNKQDMLKKLRQLKPVQYLLILIVAIAAFLRFYKIPQSVMFLGDQGRDAIIVKRIFKDLDPVFIGPVTSVGNLYLGPLYYYFMVPWLMLSYPSPLGPVYGVGLLGVVAVWLIYHWGKELVGKKAALTASILFAFSASAVTLSRFSWNPNPAPLVSLMMVVFTYRAWKKNSLYWVGVAAAFSVLIQLHYLTLLSAGGAGLIWLADFWGRFSKSKTTSKKLQELKPLLISTLLGSLVFLISLTPLVLFDLKHDGLNSKAFLEMVTGKEHFTQNAVGPFFSKIFKIIKETHGRGMQIFFEINIGQNRLLNTILLVGTILGFIYTWIAKKKNKFKAGHAVLAAYLFTGIMGTAVYEHSIFTHYIGYLFPIAFLVLGVVLAEIWQKHVIGKIAVLVMLAGFIGYNFTQYGFGKATPNLDDIKKVSQTIAQRVDENEKYNLVLLSESKDIIGFNYRYYLETTQNPPLDISLIGDTQKLFVINEQLLEDPLAQPIYEIIVFPDKEPVEVYNVENGPQVLVLERK
jgi:hypothetical protein